MAAGIASAEMAAVRDYMVSKWKRSALAGFEQGVTVNDPGHGFDEICPIVISGVPFDELYASDVAPFSVDQLWHNEGNEGVGFITIDLRPLSAPMVLSPGLSPEMREDFMLGIFIAIPSRGGIELAYEYAGALAMIWRFIYLEYQDSYGTQCIRNLTAPQERPSYQPLDDDNWLWFLLEVPLARFYRAPAAITA